MCVYINLLEINMQDHLRGKQHLAMQQANNYRMELAERSVFVRNFHPTVSQEELINCFSAQGSVQKVIINTEGVK